MSSNPDFVRVNNRLFILERLDEELRIFLGYKMYKQTITDLLDDKEVNLVEYKILFGTEKNTILKKATLVDFSNLYPIFDYFSLYYETDYKNALARIEGAIDIKRKWRSSLKPDLSYPKLIIVRYTKQLEEEKIHNLQYAERSEWLKRIADKWGIE